MENYIEQIKKLCAENNIDPTEIVNKITRRFKLGQQAGMSEEEIIEMLGEPESYVAKKEDVKQEIVPTFETVDEGYDYDLLEIEVAADVDLDIKTSSDEQVKVDFFDDEQLKAIYSFAVEDKKIKLIPIKNYKRVPGYITLYLPEKATYKDIKLSTVNGDIECQNYGMICQEMEINSVSADIDIIYVNAKNVDLSNVTGDIIISNLFAENVDMSNVSGDILVKEGKVEKLDVSTISGDVIYNGVVDTVDTSTISGDVSINEKTVSRTIAETIKDGLKNLKF